MLSDSIIHPISQILTKINPLLINESIRSIYSFQLIQLQLRTIAFNPIKRLSNHLYSPSRRQTQWNIVPTTEISFLADNRAAIAPIKVRALAPFAYSNCCLEATPSDSDGRVGMRLIWLSNRATKPCRALLHRKNICKRTWRGVDVATRRCIELKRRGNRLSIFGRRVRGEFNAWLNLRHG